jgi:Tol biopolymer transport system component
MNADGTGQKQLTVDGKNNLIPIATADNRYIVFVSNRAGTAHIWRMDIDGSNVRQLTNGQNERDPDCSPDTQWVVYVSSDATGKQDLWKVSIDGSNAVQLTEPPLLYSIPIISPDGKQIVCIVNDLEMRKYRVAIIPAEGGKPTKIFDLPRSVSLPNLVTWMPDGRSLLYIDTRAGVSNLWTQPLDGNGAPKQLTDFKSDLIGNFFWSRDGRQLLLTRGTLTNDAIMISNFK